MELALTDILLLSLATLASLAMWVIRRLASRVELLEETRYRYMTEKEIRNLVDDKVDPVKDRMQRIEYKLDEIITLLMSK